MKKFYLQSFAISFAICVSGCATNCGSEVASWGVMCGVTHAMGTNKQTHGYLEAERQRAESSEDQAIQAQVRARNVNVQVQKTISELSALERSSSPLRKQAEALRKEMSEKKAEMEIVQQDVDDLRKQIGELSAKKDKSAADWARRKALVDELNRQQDTINSLDRYIEHQLLTRAAEILRNG